LPQCQEALDRSTNNRNMKWFYHDLQKKNDSKINENKINAWPIN